MKGFTWDSTEEFTVEHYRLIESICHLVVENDEAIADLAQDIWSAALPFAGRTFLKLSSNDESRPCNRIREQGHGGSPPRRARMP